MKEGQRRAGASEMLLQVETAFRTFNASRKGKKVKDAFRALNTDLSLEAMEGVAVWQAGVFVLRRVWELAGGNPENITVHRKEKDDVIEVVMPDLEDPKKKTHKETHLLLSERRRQY